MKLATTYKSHAIHLSKHTKLTFSNWCSTTDHNGPIYFGPRAHVWRMKSCTLHSDKHNLRFKILPRSTSSKTHNRHNTNDQKCNISATMQHFNIVHTCLHSPPARWGLLDFMSVAAPSPHPPPPDLNHDYPRPVFAAGPQPRPATPSVRCRTSTTTSHAQCSLPDLNHDHQRPPSVRCRTSTAGENAR